MVGIERKNENSRAAGRDMPTSSPAVIVDMDLEVPGKIAERTWQHPIKTACPKVISSMVSVRWWLESPYMESTSHITMPPIKSAEPMIIRLSRCFPMVLVSRKAGTPVKTKAIKVRGGGWLKTVRYCLSPLGEV